MKQTNVISFTILCNACALLQSDEGPNIIKQMKADIRQQFYSNIQFVTSLLDALGKCGDITSAQTLFDSQKNKDIEMYGALLKGSILC